MYRNVTSGRYYARVFLRGKETWRALKTDVYQVAASRLGEHTSEARQRRAAGAAVEGGKATMGDLATTYLERVEANEDLQPASKAARRHAVARIRRTWPGFDALAPKAITLGAVIDWVNSLKKSGTGFVPPGAKRALSGNSSTAVNTAVDALRRLLDIAVERGVVFTNVARMKPPEGRLKKRIVGKALTLPTLDQFRRLFDEIEQNGGLGGWGVEAADFCRFLAFTGCRRGEAAAICWQHFDRERGTLAVPGTKSATSARVIPVFPPLGELLAKIRERRRRQARIAVGGEPHVPADEKILRVTEAQRSIDRACAALGIARLTHHDLRHAFATVAVEAGVDVPTVARWLGHADGGALAMKTYGHLRDEHSQTSALKVTWEVRHA